MEDGKEKPRHEVKVGASPVRCPYCHEDVQPLDSTWVACGGCMARHHEACWDERGSCSTCGGVRRLVSEARQGPTDAELVELVRSGDRGRATAALRARGLDESAARAAVELVVVALAPTAASRAAWQITGGVFGLQAFALVVCGLLARTSEAEIGAFAGLAVLVAASVALAVVALAVGRRLARWAIAGLAATNLLAIALGPAVVVGADVGASEQSVELLALGLLMGAASAGVAWWCWPGRQSSTASSFGKADAASRGAAGGSGRA